MIRALLAVCWVSSIAAASDGVVGGRLMIEVSSPIGAAPLSPAVTLRRGRELLHATVEPDGTFVARGAPGDYRLEYVGFGLKAEYFRPLLLHISPDAVTCAGELALRLRSLDKAGDNAGTSFDERDTCGELAPRLSGLAGLPARTALATPATVSEVSPPKSAAEIVSGLRLEYDWGFAPAPSLEGRIGYAFAFIGELEQPRSISAMVSVGQTFLQYTYALYDVTVGVSYNLLGFIELYPDIGYRVPKVAGDPRGFIAAGVVHVTRGGLGFGFRAEVLPSTNITFFGSIAPLELLGVLL